MGKPELVPPKDEPKPWTPDQPLEDADDETEAQVRARRAARQRYLEKQVETPAKEEKSKKIKW